MLRVYRVAVVHEGRSSPFVAMADSWLGVLCAKLSDHIL